MHPPVSGVPVLYFVRDVHVMSSIAGIPSVLTPCICKLVHNVPVACAAAVDPAVADVSAAASVS
jgi:hypothetical protein